MNTFKEIKNIDEIKEYEPCSYREIPIDKSLGNIIKTRVEELNRNLEFPIETAMLYMYDKTVSKNKNIEESFYVNHDSFFYRLTRKDKRTRRVPVTTVGVVVIGYIDPFSLIPFGFDILALTNVSSKPVLLSSINEMNDLLETISEITTRTIISVGKEEFSICSTLKKKLEHMDFSNYVYKI